MENGNNEDVIAKNETRQMRPSTNDSDGSNSTRPSMPPNMNCEDGETCEPPEINCDSDSENCEIPEPPEGFDGEMPEEIQNMRPSGKEFVSQMAKSSDSVLHPVAYLAIGGCSVIMGILVSYAIFSKFFHLKPGQTFSQLSKFIWFIVVVLVIAAGLIALGYFIPVWVKG